MSKILLKWAHWPTLLFVIGYPVFWIELYVIKRQDGTTSLLGLALLAVASVFYYFFYSTPRDVSVEEKSQEKFVEKGLFYRIFIIVGSLLALAILFCGFYASCLPVHLIQEFDALQYHITLPRQHLILGSFQHIPWAADDLFFLPLDFALAPFWLVTTLPNKFPQFIFFIGLILVSMNLMNYFEKNQKIKCVLIFFAILGSHNITIQMGTAMLDLVMLYLFLAALDSLIRGRTILFCLESTFFLWSKSLIPVQMVMIGIIILFLVWVLKAFKVNRVMINFQKGFGEEVLHQYRGKFRKIILMCVILSSFVGGPFAAKSLYYSGTLVFPFGTGSYMINKNIDTNSTHWRSIMKSSEKFMTGIKDGYGYGRSVSAFVKHFWIIAVPEKGVNNKYDYPLGLVYLLFLGPFIYYLIRSIKEKKIAMIPLFIVVYWMTWWGGTHQSRFLYVPVLLMAISVISNLESPSKILMGCLVLALMFNAISVFRTHRHDFGLWGEQVLRPKDVDLLKKNKEYFERKQNQQVDLDFHDAAYARFPVRVTREQLPHTLAL